MAKKKKKKKSGFSRGFKETKIPGDRGYVKDRKGGGRYHKYSKSGKIHIDRKDPKKTPLQHIKEDVLGIKKKRKRRKKKK